MREIKFRGKRRDTGEWVYGAYLYHGWMYVVGKDWERKISVISETVGQYIGLEDINGKEIYENDFILINGEKHVVQWKGMGFWYCHIDDEELLADTCYDSRAYLVEIIGNVHDNT